MTLSLPIFAAVKVTETIRFEANGTQLSLDAKKKLAAFGRNHKSFVPEKIDITGFCGSSMQSYHCMKTARQRSMNVLTFLQAHFPEESLYEFRLSREANPSQAAQNENTVLITGYFLESNQEEVAPAMLFPEEFAFELPQNIQKSGLESEPRYILGDVEFMGNSAFYVESSEPALQSFASYLALNEEIHVVIEGHVNGNMGRRYLKKAGKSNPEKTVYKNAKHLSLARAETIKEYLVNEGIAESRVACLGKGGAHKLYPNPQNDEENRANRRIEVLLNR